MMRQALDAIDAGDDLDDLRVPIARVLIASFHDEPLDDLEQMVEAMLVIEMAENGIREATTVSSGRTR